MAALNISNFRNTSLIPFLIEKFVTKKDAQLKICQKVSKNFTPGFQPINKQIVNQTFDNTSRKIIPNSQLQNQVVSLKPQVLEAKKTTKIALNFYHN